MADEAPLFKQCLIVYEKMMEQAEPHDDNEENPIFVWEGSLVKYIDEIGVGQHRYSYVMNALKEMGCVVQIRRGANTVPSQWALLKAPENEVFSAKMDNKRYNYTTKKPKSVMTPDISQRFADLNERVSLLEEWREEMTSGAASILDGQADLQDGLSE